MPIFRSVWVIFQVGSCRNNACALTTGSFRRNTLMLISGISTQVIHTQLPAPLTKLPHLNKSITFTKSFHIMAAKFFFTCAGSFIGTQVISAQSSVVLYSERWSGPDVAGSVRQLEINALYVFIGAVVLMGLAWIFSVVKACLSLSKPVKTLPKSLLILVIGLSFLGESCSVVQRATAKDYALAEKAESRNCRHYMAQEPSASFSQQNPYMGYSQVFGPGLCKFCGRKIKKGY
jgi:hypothetical protein